MLWRHAGSAMNNIRLGLFQESSDQFALAVHADVLPQPLYAQFHTQDLRVAIVEGQDGVSSVELVTVPDQVAQARDLIHEVRSRHPDSRISGGVMALESFSDSWNLMVLRDSAPGYHVALAFSLYPLRVSFGEGTLFQIGYEEAAAPNGGTAWNMLNSALAAQAIAIFFPDAPTLADGCARLADRPGVVDYLLGMGDPFSLTDIEQLARLGQGTASFVAAMAEGMQGEDRTWMYQVKLSERAIASAGLLAVSYARAKVRHLAGLRGRPPRTDLRDERLRFREMQIERFAHHLALLELCAEYGIGLWSRPMSRGNDDLLDSDGEQVSGRWSVAVAPQ
jgi:hypothetical protein